MRDLRAFPPSLAKELAEMLCLVIETAGGEGLIEFHDAPIAIMNRGMARVPPIGVDKNVAARPGQESIAVAEKVDARMQLRISSFMLGMEDGEGIHAG